MTLPSSAFARITHRITSAGASRPAFVTYCVNNGTELSLNSIATACNSAFDNLVNTMTTEWAHVETNVKLGPEETGPQASFAITPSSGTEAPPTATPQVAYLLVKTTALGGRRNRGRMYLPGVKESYVGVGGALDSTVTASLTTAALAFLNGLDTALMPLHIEHDPATTWTLVNGQPRRVPTGAAIPAPTEVVEFRPSSLVATQRRRLR